MYILLTLRKSDINTKELQKAIWKKAEERNSTVYIENYRKYLNDISNSRDVLDIWNSYKGKYSYAGNIDFHIIIEIIKSIMEK